MRLSDDPAAYSDLFDAYFAAAPSVRLCQPNFCFSFSIALCAMASERGQ